MLETEWKDPKDNSPHKITIKPDRSFEIRSINKVLGTLWKHTHDFLVQEKRWKRGYAMGSTGHRGHVFISTNDDIHDIFKVKKADATFQIEPLADNLELFGISATTAKSFIDAALARTPAAQ